VSLNEVTKKLKCQKCGCTDYNDIRCRLCGKCAFPDDELREAAYEGNIGAMEMFKFYQVASDEQKKLMAFYLKQKFFDKAWDLLKRVTGVDLR